MPVLMTFSRSVAAGVQRKNLDGCSVLGEWIVVPEERRIERDGRVIGMSRNLMDALLCLIDAQGASVSLERLKGAMWPSSIVSDETAKSYMNTLQRALETDSALGTVVESNTECGYRLLVNARPARPDDAPKSELTRRQVPADPFKVNAEVAGYILSYHSNLMTELEHRAQGHFHAKMKMTGWGDRSPQLQASVSQEYSRYLATDPAVLELVNDGYEAFAERAASRILKEYGDRLNLNRCPSCACIARTPKARQCRFCGRDWHDG